MHSIAKKELLKKCIEITDAIVTIFELDKKIDEAIGIPWKTNDNILSSEDIEKLIEKYDLHNKGEKIYEKRKKIERKEKVESIMALFFCLFLYFFIGYLVISLLLKI